VLRCIPKSRSLAGVAAAAVAPLTEVALLAVPDRAKDGVMGEGTANRKEDDEDKGDGVEAADEGADSVAERNAGGCGGCVADDLPLLSGSVSVEEGVALGRRTTSEGVAATVGAPPVRTTGVEGSVITFIICSFELELELELTLWADGSASAVTASGFGVAAAEPGSRSTSDMEELRGRGGSESGCDCDCDCGCDSSIVRVRDDCSDADGGVTMGVDAAESGAASSGDGACNSDEDDDDEDDGGGASTTDACG
jgi:hypothetical protein